MNADRLVELAKAILERASLAVVAQQLIGTARFFRPVRHQEKPTRHQVQLSRFWIGLIDHNEDQTLGVRPRVDLVRAELNGVLVSAGRWPARRTNDVLGGQCVELGVGLQSPDKTPVFATQFIHHAGDRVSRVKPIIDVLGDCMGVVIGLVDKAFHSVCGVNLTLAKRGVNEAVTRSLAIASAVVVAVDAQGRDQRMVDRLLVVAVVAGSMLLAVNFDGKAVDVDGGLFDAAASRSDDVSLNTISQSVSDRFEIALLSGQNADQAGLSGLACQSLVGDLVSPAVPNGSPKGRIMGKPVDIILSGTTDSHGKNTFTNQFVDAVSNAVGSSGVADVLGDCVEQAEPMLGVAKQDDSGVRRDSMICRLNLDGAIELGLEKVTLVFTHRVIPCSVWLGLR